MTYYSVYGTVVMPREVYEKERIGILHGLMQWSPDSEAESTFSVLNINSRTIGISFDDFSSYQKNIYRDIRESLLKELKALKEKYSDSVKGELMITSTDGEYYAARIELDREEYELFTLQRSN